MFLIDIDSHPNVFNFRLNQMQWMVPCSSQSYFTHFDPLPFWFQRNSQQLSKSGNIKKNKNWTTETNYRNFRMLLPCMPEWILSQRPLVQRSEKGNIFWHLPSSKELTAPGTPPRLGIKGRERPSWLPALTKQWNSCRELASSTCL